MSDSIDYTIEVEQRIHKCREERLPTLDLSGCALSKIPDAVFGLTHLIELNLGDWRSTDRNWNNHIHMIPSEIACLQNLQQLYLSFNQLTTLPESITQLQSLQQLYLSGNQLTTLPESITQLQSLQQLYLSGNQLTTLPESITQLQSLQRLDLRNNQLQTLPKSIIQLQNLQRLDLANNPLQNPPLEVARAGIVAIRHYFQELKSQPEDHLFEAKLLLVGEGRVGKTVVVKW